MSRDQPRTEALAEVPAERQRDALDIARVALSCLAVLAAVALVAVHVGLRGESRYLPGPLATPHAALEQNCSTCHVDFAPLGGTNWLALASGQAHGADAQCQSCHAGPAHHADQKASEVASCTTCHREHRGRSASLTRMDDDQCLRCHGDLAHHLEKPRPSKFDDVTGFPDGHPEFRLIRDKAGDPGKIAFNHALHMKAGLRNDAKSHVPFALARLPADLRDRYRRPGEADNAPVQLECASCHRTDSGKASGGPARPEGGAMLPIVFEQHCQACHPLTFADAARQKVVSVRHGLQPAELRAFLQGYFAQELLEREPVEPARPSRPLPGRKQGVDKATLARWLEDNVQRAEKVLFGASTCGQCHAAALEVPPRIEPARVPNLWFEHARFDHTTHRTTDCRTCHAAAYATNPDGSDNPHASRVHRDVLLPGIAVCRTCHAPAPQGSARFDCVQCHRYHGGDDPLHGRGATIRGPLR